MTNLKKILGIIISTVIMTASISAYADQITVPAGQTIQAIVTTPINSKNLSLGQTVTMVVGEDFYYNNKLIAPFESVLTGSVINVSKAKDKTAGKIYLRFTEAVTPYGIQIPLAAIIKTSDKTGKLSGENLEYKDEGNNVNIPVNKPIELLLTQPITVNPEVYNSNY